MSCADIVAAEIMTAAQISKIFFIILILMFYVFYVSFAKIANNYFNFVRNESKC